jgi:hypothetical protein
MAIRNFPAARVLQPAGDHREDDKAVSYQALPLAPATKSKACTDVGTLAGNSVEVTLQTGSELLEVICNSYPMLLTFNLAFGGSEEVFGELQHTFSDALSGAQYDRYLSPDNGIETLAIPEGAVSYTYQFIGTAGTVIFIER